MMTNILFGDVVRIDGHGDFVLTGIDVSTGGSHRDYWPKNLDRFFVPLAKAQDYEFSFRGEKPWGPLTDGFMLRAPFALEDRTEKGVGFWPAPEKEDKPGPLSVADDGAITLVGSHKLGTIADPAFGIHKGQQALDNAAAFPLGTLVRPVWGNVVPRGAAIIEGMQLGQHVDPTVDPRKVGRMVWYPAVNQTALVYNDAFDGKLPINITNYGPAKAPSHTFYAKAEDGWEKVTEISPHDPLRDFYPAVQQALATQLARLKYGS